MIITSIYESNDCHNPGGPAGGQFCSSPHDTTFTPGQTVRFSGEAIDRSVTGDMDVVIVDPHSNRSQVTHVTPGRKPRAYVGASSHLPTARVRNARGREFDVHHHALRRKA